jgi:hypothetical protein
MAGSIGGLAIFVDESLAGDDTESSHQPIAPNKSLDASGGSVFRKIIGPAMIE